ncbi:MAG: ParB/RepB/Spo0J family partition protein [Bacteroidia bacterium]|nr:ParB/RepB/Spo0J family partition protein [Bacteroidia bacterium]
MNPKKSALGRGLSALLENPGTDITSRNNTPSTSPVAGNVSSIPIAQIETNPFQPRTHFDLDALHELADSIKQLGIIQPLTVRKLGYDKYQLISGERRFRASQLAGLTEVPAYVRIANDQSMLEMALVENIQREDLDAMEVAESYRRLVEECNLTQEQLSERVGKKRSTVTNYLRLLRLPAEIQLAIRTRQISMGHARGLVNVDSPEQQLAIFKKILEDGLSVRQVEDEVKTASLKKKKKPTPARIQMALSFEIQKIKEDLSQTLETKVTIRKNDQGGGEVVIPFLSDDDLLRIYSIIEP